jgi:glutamate-5-semialdehyde dehydrogenase
MACFLKRTAIQAENQQDLNYSGGDLAMEKRLLVDDAKIDGMILKNN